MIIHNKLRRAVAVNHVGRKDSTLTLKHGKTPLSPRHHNPSSLQLVPANHSLLLIALYFHSKERCRKHPDEGVYKFFWGGVEYFHLIWGECR